MLVAHILRHATTPSKVNCPLWGNCRAHPTVGLGTAAILPVGPVVVTLGGCRSGTPAPRTRASARLRPRAGARPLWFCWDTLPTDTQGPGRAVTPTRGTAAGEACQLAASVPSQGDLGVNGRGRTTVFGSWRFRSRYTDPSPTRKFESDRTLVALAKAGTWEPGLK